MAAPRVLVVGQAPPRDPGRDARPFARSRFYGWLRSAGISDESAADFQFAALVDTFPGKSKHGDRPPTPPEIATGRAQLHRVLARTRPTIVVPMGKLAVQQALTLPPQSELVTVIGRSYRARPFAWGRRLVTILPLPHPSGASTWVHQRDNTRLLLEALRLLREALDKS